MKITATYIAEDGAYTIQADEQQIVVPKAFMSRFVSCVEAALYRQRLVANQLKAERARKLVEEANHPAILPFTSEESEPTIKPKGGRPKGTKYTLPVEQRLKKAVAKKKRKPPKSEPQPFRHIPFK